MSTIGLPLSLQLQEQPHHCYCTQNGLPGKKGGCCHCAFLVGVFKILDYACCLQVNQLCCETVETLFKNDQVGDVSLEVSHPHTLSHMPPPLPMRTPRTRHHTCPCTHCHTRPHNMVVGMFATLYVHTQCPAVHSCECSVVH